MVAETGQALLTLESESEEDTRAIAAALAEVLEAGDVVALEGTLGAGKTLFVTALARALGVPPEVHVASPTYALVHHYAGGRLPVAHLDLYRVGDDGELDGIGFDDLLDEGVVAVVEWPERAARIGEVATFWLTFTDTGPTRRGIRALVGPEESARALERSWARFRAPRRP